MLESVRGFLTRTLVGHLFLMGLALPGLAETPETNVISGFDGELLATVSGNTINMYSPAGIVASFQNGEFGELLFPVPSDTPDGNERWVDQAGQPREMEFNTDGSLALGSELTLELGGQSRFQGLRLQAPFAPPNQSELLNDLRATNYDADLEALSDTLSKKYGLGFLAASDYATRLYLHENALRAERKRMAQIRKTNLLIDSNGSPGALFSALFIPDDSTLSFEDVTRQVDLALLGIGAKSYAEGVGTSLGRSSGSSTMTSMARTSVNEFGLIPEVSTPRVVQSEILGSRSLTPLESELARFEYLRGEGLGAQPKLSSVAPRPMLPAPAESVGSGITSSLVYRGSTLRRGRSVRGVILSSDEYRYLMAFANNANEIGRQYTTLNGGRWRDLSPDDLSMRVTRSGSPSQIFDTGMVPSGSNRDLLLHFNYSFSQPTQFSSAFLASTASIQFALSRSGMIFDNSKGAWVPAEPCGFYTIDLSGLQTHTLLDCPEAIGFSSRNSEGRILDFDVMLKWWLIEKELVVPEAIPGYRIISHTPPDTNLPNFNVHWANWRGRLHALNYQAQSNPGQLPELLGH